MTRARSVRPCWGTPKKVAQVRQGQHLPAQVHHAQQKRGRTGHGGEVHQPHHLANVHRLDGVTLMAQRESEGQQPP